MIEFKIPSKYRVTTIEINWVMIESDMDQNILELSTARTIKSAFGDDWKSAIKNNAKLQRELMNVY